MSLDAGQRLGTFEILGYLGAGGMGEVYRGLDTALDRDVALKVLPELFALDGERLARFKREAQVLASLNHQNTPPIYGFVESDPSPGSESAVVHALVLELVEGPTLADRLAQGPIPSTRHCQSRGRLRKGSKLRMRQGIIHRDPQAGEHQAAS